MVDGGILDCNQGPKSLPDNITSHTQMLILSGASRVGTCGEGGVVQRSLQREKDSGDSGK